MTQDRRDVTELLERACAGDPQALGALFALHHDRLRRVVQLRLDHRLKGRLDPSDVLQEAFLEATTRFPEYRERPAMPFYLWLRFLTTQRLLILHRQHLQTKARDARRDVPLFRDQLPGASSAELAAHLLGHRTSPSQAAIRAEMKRKLHEALDQMGPLDREILALRHVEQLTNSEAARVLGLRESTASQRYVTALLRVKALLIPPGDPGEVKP
jgi:RNA polymerase sigma-70 factor (ECF subfamily)